MKKRKEISLAMVNTDFFGLFEETLHKRSFNHTDEPFSMILICKNPFFAFDFYSEHVSEHLVCEQTPFLLNVSLLTVLPTVPEMQSVSLEEGKEREGNTIQSRFYYNILFHCPQLGAELDLPHGVELLHVRFV